jgi:hypothetical protein
MGRFIGAAHSLVAPTNALGITTAAPSSSSGKSLLPEKKRKGGLGHLPKIALLRGAKVLISILLVERF